MNSARPTETRDNKDIYSNLFEPQSIAIIGASNDALKPGGRVTKNIKENNYPGLLWAINPKTEDILGLPTFAKISELPHGPDLAIIAIPSKFVLQALQELADISTKSVIILTSGFGEKNEQGKVAEQKMLAIAKSAYMTLIGPNCSGFITKCYKGKFAGIIPTLPGSTVDFISGSGATVDYVMEYALTRGLSFGNVVNLGNSIQMGVEDLLELYDENYGATSAKILMLYLETVKKPAKLLRHAQSLAKKGCSLVGIKSGVTDAGERAAASHTGAIATSDTAVDALFDKAGIIRVNNRSTLVDVASVLAATSGSLRGRRACVITDAGGPGVMLCDELSRQGFDLPPLSVATQIKLAEILPAEASMVNPIDALPSRSAAQIKEILLTLEETEADNIDIITVLLGDSGMSDNAPIYKEISQAMDDCRIPIIPMFSSLLSSQQKINTYCSQGKIFFSDEVSLGHALGIVSRRKSVHPVELDHDWYDLQEIEKILESQSGVLTPKTVSKVLLAAGFTLPEEHVFFDKEQLAKNIEAQRFPLAMKVIGPLHKSDVGGVKLNLRNEQEAMKAWDELMQIQDAQGVMIQPMVTGTEVILGTSREGEFGHLIMFGLGGIYAEVFSDVSFNLAPINANESLQMIQDIKSFPILEGVRGEAGMSIEILSQFLQRLSYLVSDFPQIREIDLNPVKGVGDELYVVDARIIID